MIDAWAGNIPNLNQLQLQAINEYGVLRGEHLVASAPTSAGKAMIGELAAISRGVMSSVSPVASMVLIPKGP